VEKIQATPTDLIKSTTIVKYVLKRIFNHSLHAVFLEDYDALNLPAGRADRMQHFLQQKRAMHFNRCVRGYFRRTFSHYVDLGYGVHRSSASPKKAQKSRNKDVNL